MNEELKYLYESLQYVRIDEEVLQSTLDSLTEEEKQDAKAFADKIYDYVCSRINSLIVQRDLNTSTMLYFTNVINCIECFMTS